MVEFVLSHFLLNEQDVALDYGSLGSDSQSIRVRQFITHRLGRTCEC